MAVRRGIAATIRALFAGVLARALALLGAFFGHVSLSLGRSFAWLCELLVRFFSGDFAFGGVFARFFVFLGSHVERRPSCGLELGARVGAPWFAAPAGAAVCFCFSARCALGLRASDSGKQRRGTRRLI